MLTTLVLVGLLAGGLHLAVKLYKKNAGAMAAKTIWTLMRK